MTEFSSFTKQSWNNVIIHVIFWTKLLLILGIRIFILLNFICRDSTVKWSKQLFSPNIRSFSAFVFSFHLFWPSMYFLCWTCLSGFVILLKRHIYSIYDAVVVRVRISSSHIGNEKEKNMSAHFAQCVCSTGFIWSLQICTYDVSDCIENIQRKK